VRGTIADARLHPIGCTPVSISTVLRQCRRATGLMASSVVVDQHEC